MPNINQTFSNQLKRSDYIIFVSRYVPIGPKCFGVFFNNLLQNLELELLTMQTDVKVFHDALKPISWLSGSWNTKEGQGKFPNIADFKYHETLEFTSIGQPMFNFASISSHPEKQTPMHQERGFLRVKPGTNELAFVISHNFGLTSVEEGTCDPESKEINLQSVNVSRISFAKPPRVTKIKRCMKLLEPNVLEVVVYMETEDTPLTQHLKAVYNRSEATVL